MSSKTQIVDVVKRSLSKQTTQPFKVPAFSLGVVPRDSFILPKLGVKLIKTGQQVMLSTQWQGAKAGFFDQNEDRSSLLDQSLDFNNTGLKNVTTAIRLSNVLFRQQTDDGSLEQMIETDMQNAIWETLSKAVLGDADGTGATPRGVCYNATEKNLLATADIVALIKATPRCFSPNFVVSPTIIDQLIQLRSNDTTTPIFNHGKILGMETTITSTVSDGCFVYGDFSSIQVTQVGDIFFTVDTYTHQDTGEVVIWADGFFCVGYNDEVPTIGAIKVQNN